MEKLAINDEFKGHNIIAGRRHYEAVTCRSTMGVMVDIPIEMWEAADYEDIRKLVSLGQMVARDTRVNHQDLCIGDLCIGITGNPKFTGIKFSYTRNDRVEISRWPLPSAEPQKSEAVDLLKVRRRIEDALRKTATEENLLTIANILGVKTE